MLKYGTFLQYGTYILHEHNNNIISVKITHGHFDDIGAVSELGIPEDEVICGAISLGYSKQNDMNPLKRNGNPVIFVK